MLNLATYLAIYPVGMSKDCSCFTQMIHYNSMELVRILTKIDTDNRLWMPYKCTKFQLDWSTSLRVTAIFSNVQKDEEEKKNKEKNSKVCSLISRKRFTRFSSNLVCSLPW